MNSATLAAYKTLRRIRGVEVTYRRDAVSICLVAVVDGTRFEVADEAGTLVKSKVRDYLILAADLVLSGSAADPQRGDAIVETIGSRQYTYEVIGPAGEHCYKWWDTAGQVLRVHGSEIQRESV